MLLACLLACSKPEGGAVASPAPRVDALETRFKAHAEGWEPTPEQAFALRERCPVVERAEMSWDGDFGVLRLLGRLEGVDRLVVQLGGGRVAESRAHVEADGSLRFAVACKDCELVPGFAVGERHVGCRGPGHSILLVSGTITPQP